MIIKKMKSFQKIKSIPNTGIKFVNFKYYQNHFHTSKLLNFEISDNNYVNDTDNLFTLLKFNNADLHEIISQNSKDLLPKINECKNIIGDSMINIETYEKNYKKFSDDYFYKRLIDLKKGLNRWDLIINDISENKKIHNSTINSTYYLFRKKIPSTAFLFINSKEYEIK